MTGYMLGAALSDQSGLVRWWWDRRKIVHHADIFCLSEKPVSSPSDHAAPNIPYHTKPPHDRPPRSQFSLFYPAAVLLFLSIANL